ncbi:hypothetical protein ACFYU5_33465 [Nocardia aobensis]|uniref:Uncharacterized protein n=1 Tax=Nocardia aobensis TaxID=257277 RepID=A0ABW6PDU7_9NOCA
MAVSSLTPRGVNILLVDDQTGQQLAKLFAYMKKRFDSLEQDMKVDIETLREGVRTGGDQVAAKPGDEVERAAIISHSTATSGGIRRPRRQPG